ncbi:MAG: cyclase family protein [Thermomicrobiales bacterium]|nr:cyclase family protein [Thermomicrobiales bacterium]
MVRFVDLSHVIEGGVATYPGLPAPAITDFLSREASRRLYADGTEFHIGEIRMVANTGTYLDAPFHRFADGMDVSELDLRLIAGLPGLLVDVSERDDRAIDADAFDLDVAGKAVLVRTEWARHWRSEAYFTGHPFLSRRAAELLAERGAALVGIDSLNIDDTSDPYRPAHTALLGAGIPIVEHLTGLYQLPATGFRFFAVPPRVRGLGSFPIRAFAELEVGG